MLATIMGLYLFKHKKTKNNHHVQPMRPCGQATVALLEDPTCQQCTET